MTPVALYYACSGFLFGIFQFLLSLSIRRFRGDI